MSSSSSVKIHPSAIVAPEAELGEGVSIGPYCIVDSRVKIGAGTKLSAFVVVHDNVTIGNNCRIAEYTAVGGDPQDRGFKGEETWVHIGNNNIIRENVTINRATGEGGETIVGNDCFIMDGVHLAHNVHIGNSVTIANKVGLAGFVSVGDHTVFGGIAGAHQFVRIGEYCMIGGLYRVTKDVPHYTMAGGEPLRLEGLNSIGLKRAGFSSEARRAIRAFYHDLYERDMRVTEALSDLRARRESLLPEVQKILDFYDGSKRGVTFWAVHKSGHNSED